MADNLNVSGGGGNAMLGVIVGLLVAAVLVLGFFVYNGGMTSGDGKVDIDISAPKVPAPGAGGGKPGG